MEDATLLRENAAMSVNDGVPIAGCATAADPYRRKVCSPESLPASKDICLSQTGCSGRWSCNPNRRCREHTPRRVYRDFGSQSFTPCWESRLREHRKSPAKPHAAPHTDSTVGPMKWESIAVAYTVLSIASRRVS